ncbi:MAG: hypothetical protein E6Q73_00775 [Pseudorhodobacter sp.]|nr:MAG: hypothetical protein E6Q73_00775 [Pseudorhodobacter sp.]
MKRLALPALLLLAACGTPQEQCISANTRDLQVVDRLIRDTESNLARGYGFETVTEYEPQWIDCTPRPTEANPEPAREMCFDRVPVTVRKEVALDLNAEAAKLKSLKAKRAGLAKTAESVIAQCKAKFPE